MDEDGAMIRAAALAKYRIVDSAREAVFDGIAELAASVCEAPIAVINFIDRDRQFFKAEVGLGVDGTPLETSLCAHALLEDEFLLVPDTTQDARFACNPLVTGAPYLRFYAGALLRTPEGVAIGTVCVLDYRTRTLSDVQVRTLRVLAQHVMAQLEHGLASRQAALAEARQRAIVDNAIDLAIVAIDRDGMVVEWGTGADHVFGWDKAAAIGRHAGFLFTPEDRAVGRLHQDMVAADRDGRARADRWHLCRTGRRLWCSVEVTPLTGRDGRQLGYVLILRDRSEQHRVGTALKVAEQGQRWAQQAGRLGLFQLGADAILHATPEFCRLFGLAPAATLPAATIESLILPEDREHAAPLWTADGLGDGAGVRELEYRIRRAGDGVVRWIAHRGERLIDGETGAFRIAGMVQDVTERRVATDILAGNEQRYRALFEAFDDGFCIIEFFDGPHGPLSDYVHVEANAGYQRHSGIAEIVGRTLRDLAPDQADDWIALYGTVLRTGEPIRFERYFEQAGRHIEVSAARVEPASRRQVSVMFRDIDARKASEAALRASEALARENIERVQLALAAGAIIGTWFWHLPTDRFTVDEVFAAAFGLDPALGRDGLSRAQVVATVHPDDQAGLAEAIDAAIARGGPYAHQYRVRRADGRYYWIEANGRVDHDADGTPLRFPGVLIDVEERRAVEKELDRTTAALRALTETLEQRVAERSAELMKTEEQLRQAQKMEAVGQLTGGLAHDFNNLLAGMSGALEMIGTRLGQGRLGDVDRYLDAAQGAVRRAAALTHRLLAFSRRQTLDPKPTDVNALIAGMIELIRRTVGPAVTVETSETVGLWTTLVDAGQLENALLNLCINARDAMPAGGRIMIETANTWLDRETARAHDMPEGSYLSLSVTDSGTGMSADVIERVFEPFFTTKPMGQGTGLGLSMIYGFAKQSGGQVRIQSQVDVGTVVRLYLPRYDGDLMPSVDHDGTRISSRAGGGETILVVDDEPTVRLLLADVLEDLGYGVVEAADGISGLRVLQSDLRIDLLISDIGLPGGMNGRQMAEAAQAHRPGLPTLFITGYAEHSVVGNGLRAPGIEIMTKPFAIDKLLTRVGELIAQGRKAA
nr:PAS domain S-box protein [Sphingomonas abaci]